MLIIRNEKVIKKELEVYFNLENITGLEVMLEKGKELFEFESKETIETINLKNYYIVKAHYDHADAMFMLVEKGIEILTDNNLEKKIIENQYNVDYNDVILYKRDTNQFFIIGEGRWDMFPINDLKIEYTV